MKKYLLALLSCLISGLAFCAPVFAEDLTASIKLTPVSRYFVIKANDVQNYSFTIENTGAKTLEFKVYAAPYNVVDENYTPEFVKETSYNQITRWITFKNPEGEYNANAIYAVEPGKKVEVHYRVSVPEDIPEGSQQCVIFSETINNDAVTGTGLRTVSRVAHIVLGHGLGSTENSAEIVDFNLTGLFTRSEVTATSKVKNSGNTDFVTAYNFKVESIFGATLYEDASNFSMLPESERRFNSKWENSPLFGVFKVKYFVNAGGVYKEKSHLVFIMPLFVIIIMLLLLTGLVFWIIILIRKRKEKSSRLIV